MYRDLKVFIFTALAFSLILPVAGCGEESADQSNADSATVSVEIAEQPPVSGWLDVVLPSQPIAMDASSSDLWILTAEGYVMKWDCLAGEWSSIETDIPLASTDPAFLIAAADNGAALLTPRAVVVFRGDQVTEIPLPEGTDPRSLSLVGEEAAVLFSNGSVGLTSGTELVTIVESAGKSVCGNFCSSAGMLAWMNTDGTVSRFDIAESLLSETLLPENTMEIQFTDGELIAGNGSAVYSEGVDTWNEYCQGNLTGNDLLYTEEGITTLSGEEFITAGLPGIPEKTCILSDGTIWSISDGAIAVWAEIGSVETRLPDADVQMLRYRMAGQTGSGSPAGSGVGDSEASFGGVFRIYESVSSRPDPFTEFPLASRDLRRSIEDLTIEELHLVGITLDPSGGDQAMVEDANGVAYVLNEGTVLRNNTHIAEITGNEVIVVQEVTVGSEDEIGGSTSIPTIFSMRLHEEGGL